MQCGSCGEEIPADIMFCPECGARQDCRAGGFTAPNSVGLSGQEVSGGRNFGVVSEKQLDSRKMSVSTLCNITGTNETNRSMLQNRKHSPTGNFPHQDIGIKWNNNQMSISRFQ